MPGMYCAFAEAGVLSFPGRNITSKSRIRRIPRPTKIAV